MSGTRSGNMPYFKPARTRIKRLSRMSDDERRWGFFSHPFIVCLISHERLLRVSEGIVRVIIMFGKHNRRFLSEPVNYRLGHL